MISSTPVRDARLPYAPVAFVPLWGFTRFVIIYMLVAVLQEVLRRRVGEHASRLQRLEAGLKLHLEVIQRLQAEETTMKIDVARLTKEKVVLLSRAGIALSEDGRGIADSELSELVRQKEDTAAKLECEKDRLRARCRELQVRVVSPVPRGSANRVKEPSSLFTVSIFHI